MSAITILPASVTPIRISPCAGLPVHIVPVPKATVKLSGVAGIPGAQGGPGKDGEDGKDGAVVVPEEAIFDGGHF